MRKTLIFYFYVCITLVNGNKYIDNFTKNKDTSQWIEHSDTEKNVGKSKASFVLQETATYQRAILFTLLDPQPCGAAFAGIRKYISHDLTPYKTINLKVKGQGSFNGYKLILKENGKNYSLCNFFEVSDNFKTVELLFDNFKPYYEGKLINDPRIQINWSNIGSVGIQAYGGAYLPIKQSGVGCLEIDWIKVE